MVNKILLCSDLDRNIVLTNPAMETTFGYSSKELAGKSPEILYANEKDF